MVGFIGRIVKKYQLMRSVVNVYTITMPQRLKSETVIVSSPLSFAGSARRIWRMTNSGRGWIKYILLTPLALLLISCAWSFVIVWYFVMYFLFGIFFIPFRLWRRGARKNKRDQLRHRELLEEIQRRGVAS